MNRLRALLARFKNGLAKDTIRQLTRYLITGFTAFGIEYLLYLLLFRGFGLHYILSSVIVYTLVFWFVFLMNRYWSFGSTGDIRKQLLQYSLLFVFNLVVANLALMYVLTDILGISPYLTPFLKTGCVVCWNFLIYKFIIYR